MPTELLDRVQRTVEVGRKAGPTMSLPPSATAARLSSAGATPGSKKSKTTTSRSLVVRLFVEGRYSSHTTTDLDPDRVAAFVNQALALTRALESDRHRIITPPHCTPADRTRFAAA